ncbi:SGNH/GDSL hydrolase family protein [Arenibacter sp. BSSL-BM3]|uniref:SGNH/GDSL hydrolase family protein n=1 Tax=Arenibacter arenosicollis TaxID=2762274 RepID=A0ABR7QIA4_9FLAO|nr:SGNH/GDSL hydrolase family protein [Arenibacter arenosicollis]MBC8766917.1 SGNH/GDSL hydrolase family protein [Arenibacter arenosicollis]
MTNLKLFTISFLTISNIFAIDVFKSKNNLTSNSEINNEHFEKLILNTSKINKCATQKSNDSIWDLKSKKDLWTELGQTKGYILNSSGKPVLFPTGAISPYFNVENVSFIQLKGFPGFLKNTDYGYLAFYDENKEIIRVIGSAQITNGLHYNISKIVGLKYIRLTSFAYNESIENVSFYTFDKLKYVSDPQNFFAKNNIDFDNLNIGKVFNSKGNYRSLSTGIITNKIKIPSWATYIMINGNEQVSLEKKSAYIVFKADDDTILSVKSYADGIRNKRIFKIPRPNPSKPTTFVEMTIRLKDENINDCSLLFLKSSNQKIVDTKGHIFGESFDYKENELLIPSEIFTLKNEPFSIFTSGMFRQYGKEKDVDISLNYTDGNHFYTRKVLEALEISSDVTGRFLVRQNDLFNMVLYKDVTIKTVDPSEVNDTISWMVIGDSLTEGNNGNDVSPYYQTKQLLASYGVIVNDFGTYHNNNKGIDLEYEGRGGWRYRTFVGLESKFAGLDLNIPNDKYSNKIQKNENPFLYKATSKDLKEFPEWCFNFSKGDTYNVSYAENPYLNSYYIFNPEAYFEKRFNGNRPDIISIALGTNEWYVQQSIYNGFDLPKIKDCIDWMLTRLRAAAKSAKIIVIPYHQIGFVRKLDWEDYAFYLAEYTTKVVEDMRANGDSNIHTLPLYCLDDPYSVIRQINGSTNVSDVNGLQIGNSSNNVHIMDYSGNNLDVYTRSLTTCILNIL